MTRRGRAWTRQPPDRRGRKRAALAASCSSSCCCSSSIAAAAFAHLRAIVGGSSGGARRSSGQSQGRGATAADRQGLQGQPSSDEYSDQFAAGFVSRQQPAAGTELRKGGTVDVWVSKGPTTVKLDRLHAGGQPRTLTSVAERATACVGDRAPGTNSYRRPRGRSTSRARWPAPPSSAARHGHLLGQQRQAAGDGAGPELMTAADAQAALKAAGLDARHGVDQQTSDDACPPARSSARTRRQAPRSTRARQVDIVSSVRAARRRRRHADAHADHVAARRSSRCPTCTAWTRRPPRSSSAGRGLHCASSRRRPAPAQPPGTVVKMSPDAGYAWSPPARRSRSPSPSRRGRAAGGGGERGAGRAAPARALTS